MTTPPTRIDEIEKWANISATQAMSNDVRGTARPIDDITIDEVRYLLTLARAGEELADLADVFSVWCRLPAPPAQGAIEDWGRQFREAEEAFRKALQGGSKGEK